MIKSSVWKESFQKNRCISGKDSLNMYVKMVSSTEPKVTSGRQCRTAKDTAALAHLRSKGSA